MVDFLFALTELSSLSVTIRSFGAMTQNVYSSTVFTGVDLFALTFYLDRVVSHQPFLASEKPRDTGLPNGENRIPLCSLVLTQYRSVTDGQTDGRMRGSKVCGFAARCKMKNRNASDSFSRCVLTTNRANSCKLAHIFLLN